MADWLTEEEDAPDAARDDELPEDGYDVQHIILPDESEPADAPRGGKFARRLPRAKTIPLSGKRRKKERPHAADFGWVVACCYWQRSQSSWFITTATRLLPTRPGGTLLSSAYGLLGMELFPAWSMDDYEIRSAEVVTGESRTGHHGHTCADRRRWQCANRPALPARSSE